MKISGGRNPVEIANGRANETTKWYFPDDKLLLSCANPIPLNNSMVSKIIVFFIVYQNFSIQVYPLFFQL